MGLHPKGRLQPFYKNRLNLNGPYTITVQNGSVQLKILTNIWMWSVIKISRQNSKSSRQIFFEELGSSQNSSKLKLNLLPDLSKEETDEPGKNKVNSKVLTHVKF
jgi:hypothetical protein